MSTLSMWHVLCWGCLLGKNYHFLKDERSYQVAALVQAGMGLYPKPVLHRQMQLIFYGFKLQAEIEFQMKQEQKNDLILKGPK